VTLHLMFFLLGMIQFSHFSLEVLCHLLMSLLWPSYTFSKIVRPVTQPRNPSYSGGKDQKDHGLNPARGK
jgi:hypothetical protein